MATTRAALVQQKWTGDKDSMIKNAVSALRDAAAQGAQVACLQELFYGPYFCQVQDPQWYSWTEEVPDGPTVRLMQDVAREHHMVLIVPVYEREQEGVYYNTAAVIDADGTFLGKHRKNHIPHVTGLLGEVLLPARQPRLPGVRHRRRPDRRLHLLRAALPGGLARARPGRRDRSCSTRRRPAGACRSTCGSWSSPRPRSPTSTSSARSTASASSRWATTTSTGQSYFADPRGQLVGGSASDSQEEVVVRDLDMDLLEEVRHQWQFYRDRRPDTYGPLVEP